MHSSESFARPRLTSIFSDIDGTLVHYDAKLRTQGYTPLYVPDSVPPLATAFRHDATGTVVPVRAVPSATLGGAYISERTIALFEALRARGVVVSLITGARTSTFLERRRSGTLPPMDFGACEGGGKMYHFDDPRTQQPGATSGAAPVQTPAGAYTEDGRLDGEWTDRFTAVIGPWRDQTGVPHLERAGPLWDVYRMFSDLSSPESEKHISGRFVNLVDDGEGNAPDGVLIRGGATGRAPLRLDAKAYDTAFMVDLRDDVSASCVLGMQGTGLGRLERAVLSRFYPQRYSDGSTAGVEGIAEMFGVDVFMNLGKGHIAARGSDKAGVTRHIAQLRQLALRSDESAAAIDRGFAAALFDDQNDLEFVELCHVGYAPGSAHPSLDAFFAGPGAAPRLAPFEDSEAQQPRYVKTAVGGFLGIESALETLLTWC